MTKELAEQLTYAPTVVRPLEQRASSFVVGGMGGSALAGDALKYFAIQEPVVVHRNYGIPRHADANALYIAISYSGNTEETVNFANEAKRAGHSVAVVTSGGTLASFAEREGLPLVRVPSGLVPRYAFFYLVRALLALIGEEELLRAIADIKLSLPQLASGSEADAHFLLQTVPLFYTSSSNALLGTLATLVMNETARVPAFKNVFPELNHGEMQAFDYDMPPGLEHLFCFYLISHEHDDPRVLRRMDVFESLMNERGRLSRRIHGEGVSRAELLATTWLHMLGVATLLAETRGINAEASPLVESFKRAL